MKTFLFVMLFLLAAIFIFFGYWANTCLPCKSIFYVTQPDQVKDVPKDVDALVFKDMKQVDINSISVVKELEFVTFENCGVITKKTILSITKGINTPVIHFDKCLLEGGVLEGFKNNEAKSFSFRDCDKITIAGIENLTSLRNIKSIRIENCQKISQQEIDSIRKENKSIQFEYHE